MFSKTFCAPEYNLDSIRGIFHKDSYEFNPTENDLLVVEELINSLNSMFYD